MIIIYFTIRLNGMAKKIFWSQLFLKNIQPNDPEYWQKAYAELLYRLDDYNEKNCSCMKCSAEKTKLLESKPHLKSKRQI